MSSDIILQDGDGQDIIVTPSPEVDLDLQNSATTDIDLINSGQGLPGAPGVGVPTGGTDGQVLTKVSGTDYDTDWETPTGGGAVSSVNGQTGVVLLDTDDISDTATNRYTNDTDVTRLANTSGTNTGDQNLAPYALDANVIHTTGNETKAGVLTLSSAPVMSVGQTLTAITPPAYSAGKLFYDNVNESLTFYNNDSNVAMNLGQEEWIKVINNTGSSIANGRAVYLSGASAGIPTIALAQANSATTTIGAGLTTETIANGATGYVTWGGLVRDFDTSAFTAGQTVYISAASPGLLTATAPTSPNYRYRIGIVGTSNASTGTIHVTPSTAALGNGTANQVFGMNAAGTAQEVKTIQGTASQVTITHTANTITASLPATINVNTSGSAATLTTARTIGTLTGDVTTAGSTFNGSANNTNATILATVNANVGSFGSATQVMTQTVNAKGLTTAAANVTITPAIGSITGLGTGIATALAVNTGSAGAPVLFNGAGGTPSSLTLTNATGLVASTGTTATGTPSVITFLRGDNTWATPAGAGTVTSVTSANTDATVATTTSTPVITIVSAPAIRKTITQAGHGFAIGDIVRLSGASTYTKSQANSASNAAVAGIVSTVVGLNDFIITIEGSVSGLSGLTAGTTYFLDPTTAGTFTSTEPVTVGQVSKPLFVADTTTSAIMGTYRGLVIASTGSGTVTNTGGNLTANSVVLGAGTNDTKVVAGVTTDGISVMRLGVSSSSTGGIEIRNSSGVGVLTLGTPPLSGNVVVTFPSLSGTLYSSGGATDVAVTDGGTGVSTLTTAYGLLAAGTTATGNIQTLTAGATTEILVGGGASALPVWTTAQGSGAPVRATSPTLTTPTLGVATATSINKVTITAPTTSATLTLVTGSSLITAGAFALTLTSAATTNATFPTGTITLADLTTTQTLAGKTLTTPTIASFTNANHDHTNAAGGGVLGAAALSTTAITIGYAQITSTFTTGSATAVQITSLTASVTIPAGGRRIKITAYCGKLYNTTAPTNSIVTIWDGTVGAGTQLASAAVTSGGANYGASITCIASVTPAAGAKTYNVGLTNQGGTTATFEASATSPAFILVEVI